ncbi:MAG: large conductance mechanosensitive channel protein MscL [Anaerolineae bacterium]
MLRSIMNEFKKFALRGNLLDMAVGIMIGSAFSGVVNSLVKDILMPPIGLILGKVDFSDLYINLSGGTYASLAEAREAGAVTLNYGLFINSVINFLIIAWVLFLIVREVNKLQPPPKPAPKTRECPYCLSQIPLAATRCAYCTSEVPAA